jgi:hypothetical protein
LKPDSPTNLNSFQLNSNPFAFYAVLAAEVLMSATVLSKELKDARVLMILSTAAFPIGLIITNYYNAHSDLSWESSERLHTSGAILAVSFATTAVLGIWSFLYVLNAPRPLPRGFKIVVGFLMGLMPWCILLFCTLRLVQDLSGLLLTFLTALYLFSWWCLWISNGIDKILFFMAIAGFLVIPLMHEYRIL